MFYVRGFHSETNTGPCVFALCYFYGMLFFIFDLLSSTPFTAPGIPVSEEAAETMWCAMNAVSTCRSKFNFFNYLVIFRHYLTGNGKVSCILATISDWFPNINRASDISQKKKIKFHGIFGDKIAERLVDFAGIFRANLAGKQSVKKRRNLWLFSGQISQQIDRFCADQTSVFNVFLTEVIICSFNNNTL